MAKHPLQQLHVICNASQNNQVITDCYRLLYKKELWMYSYFKYYAPKKTPTQYAPESNIPEVYLRIMDETILQLRQTTFPFKQLQSECNLIEHKYTQAFQCEMVETVILLILKQIYAPLWSASAYGKEKEKDRHAALIHIRKNWSNATWCIQGTLPQQIPLGNVAVLYNILEQKIDDRRFLALIVKILQSKKYQNRTESLSSNVLYKMLERIYYHEFDMFMKKQVENYQSHRVLRLKHAAIQSRMKYEANDRKCSEYLIKSVRKQPPLTVHYIRYAKTFLIGVSANKKCAKTIEAKIRKFLEQKLSISKQNYQLLFNHVNEPVPFLGYHIAYNKERRHACLKNATNTKKTMQPIKLNIPYKALHEYAKKYGYGHLNRFRIKHRKSIINQSELDIFLSYQQELIIIAKYYRLASNYHYLKKLFYLAERSFIKTIAYKRNSTINKVCRELKSHKQGHISLIHIDQNGNKSVYTFIKLEELSKSGLLSVIKKRSKKQT